MRIVWDLDGVVRELNHYLNTKHGVPYPQEWYWKWQGKDIFEWIEYDRYCPLVYAPATEYERVIKYNFERPEFWTAQPDLWIPYTKLWLDNHFPEHEVKFLSNAEKRAYLDQNPDIWLIEDNPLFTHYDRILLIDKPYNKDIENAIRIYTPEDLNAWIINLLESNMIQTS